ncbi:MULTISPECIES: ankyrin repeat domain-containing protein [unclassified Wolbachia]|uniref:ankyrin repeat domain-containing protein n=1 Tax=unclassified Wolbachia TaxID=2640676 RepID=UPI0030CA1D56
MQKIIKGLRDKLFAAIDMGKFQEVEECIKEAESRGIKDQIINSEKHTINPIHYAVYNGDLKIIRFLLNNDANVNAISTTYFTTPLHIAVTSDKLEIAQFLLDSGANINATNYEGFTPLCLASFYCRQTIVELLLCNNADTSIKDVNGKTALDVVGNYRGNICDSDTRQKITAILNGTALVDCKAMLDFIRSALEAIDTTDVVNSAVKPSSFINSMFNWVGASTTAVFGQSTPALPSAQQPVTHSAGSSISSSQVNVNGTALLADIVIRRFTGEKYSKPIDDSLLTLEQIKERKVSAIERNVKMAISEFEELYQCPGSSLSNTTISKGVHQKFF